MTQRERKRPTNRGDFYIHIHAEARPAGPQCLQCTFTDTVLAGQLATEFMNRHAREIMDKIAQVVRIRSDKP